MKTGRATRSPPVKVRSFASNFYAAGVKRGLLPAAEQRAEAVSSSEVKDDPKTISKSIAELRRRMHHDVNPWRQEQTTIVLAKAIDGEWLASFSSLSPRQSALRTFTLGQMLVLTMLGGLWLAGLYLDGVTTLIVTIACITIFYFCDIILTAFLAARTLSRTSELSIPEEATFGIRDEDWPRYTILCPLYRETEVLSQFIQAIRKIEYPVDRMQVLLLTEADDPAMREAIQTHHLSKRFGVVTVPKGRPRTKPRACNYGLLHATGEFIVIYDAEDKPDPLQLKKAVIAFALGPENLACVQAKLHFYNPKQNLLTRWFAAEYSLWFNLTLPGLQWLGTFVPLGGTSNHFRVDLLRRARAWDAFNVTEDCDLGLRLGSYGFRTMILDSTTLEEANSNLRNWLRQRSRWIKGYMQSYLVHMRRPWRYVRQGRLRDFAALQIIVGGRPATLFVNPLMWTLLGAYVVAHQRIGSAFHVLFPAPIFYIGLFCLICGNFLHLYCYVIACVQAKHYELVPWVLFIPIYWVLMSVAACMALWQLLLAPSYWEKTHHGLHLKGSEASDLALFGDSAGNWSLIHARSDVTPLRKE